MTEQIVVESEPFTTAAGFRKAQKTVREAALEKIGMTGSRLRFKPECYRLHVNYNDSWVLNQTGLSRSLDKVEMFEGSDTLFKLRLEFVVKPRKK